MRISRASSFVLPAAIFGAVAIAFSAACTSNPVPDSEIQSLGDETGDPNPDHRPGQPCVICHSAGGPASDDPFAIGGTVFHDPNSAQGVAGVNILFVDSNGSSPKNQVTTSASGNFFVRSGDWGPSFPLFVNIFNPADDTKRVMQSHIGREPSCASCHRDAFTPAEKLYSVGHISLYTTAVTPAGDSGVVGDSGGIADAGDQ